jgi:hypothetical protein
MPCVFRVAGSGAARTQTHRLLRQIDSLKAMGYYGLAWSVYSNIIGRGAEVGFGLRGPNLMPGSQFLAAADEK